MRGLDYFFISRLGADTMKPFKTHDEQLEILKSRGLIIPDERRSQIKNFLKFENYYNIVNGYKDPFLANHNPELYKPNTAFHDIYTLHQLDRNFRQILLPDLLIFETHLKSLIAYHFSEKFQFPDFYLQSENYLMNSPKDVTQLTKLISDLSKLITYKSQQDSPVKHYIESYNHVPLWVLTKFMTFGQLVQMYRFLPHASKNAIAKEFALTFNHDYHRSIELVTADLESIMRTANFFRNICAHDERLYNFRLYKKPQTARIASILNIDKHIITDGHLFTMIAMLKLVRPRMDYDRFKESLASFFVLFQDIITSVGAFQSVPFQEIMNQMGFPENWKSII